MYLTLHIHLLISIVSSQLMQYEGETALHAACEPQHVDVASLLLQHGAVVDSFDKVRLLYVSMGAYPGFVCVVSDLCPCL